MRHPIQNAHAGTHGEYMAPRRSRLLRAIWTAGTTYKEKSKNITRKNTSRDRSRVPSAAAAVKGLRSLRVNGSYEKHSLFMFLAEPFTTDRPPPRLRDGVPRKRRQKYKSKRISILDRKRFHTWTCHPNSDAEQRALQCIAPRMPDGASEASRPGLTWKRGS